MASAPWGDTFSGLDPSESLVRGSGRADKPNGETGRREGTSEVSGLELKRGQLREDEQRLQQARISRYENGGEFS